MKELYQRHTGDRQSHQRTIAAHVARLDRRKRRILAWRVQGLTLEQIAARDRRGAHKATYSSYIRRALDMVRQSIAAEMTGRQ